MSGPDLSLAIPCFNEAGHLRESASELLRVLDQTRYDYEVVFVDDCSTDETGRIIRGICRGHRRCRCVFHETNRGRGAAFKTGFRATTGRVTGFIDIDLEVHARYVPDLVRIVDEGGYDVVTGHRHYLLSQTGAIHRHLLSGGYRLACKLLLGLGVRDSETGCKFFRRSTTADVVLGSESNGWFWDTEVMSRAALAGLKIFEMPVLFLRRADKRSTVRLLPDIADYLTELYRFRGHVGLSLMDRSPIYWSAVGYDAVMSALYGRELGGVLAAIADRIPEKASVVDVCAGTCRLYLDFLRQKGCSYLGLDANGHFVMAARNRGVGARLFDVRSDRVPEADYVVMSSSFYHFHRRQREVFARLKRAAGKAVIISEPVRNLSALPIPVVGRVANLLTDPGVGDFDYRFDPDGFRAFAERNGAAEFAYREGDRNAIAVFKKAPARRTPAPLKGARAGLPRPGGGRRDA
ncbi:MAG: glycosyltransferase [Deltaproteobacteria bacterium]|nr:glycosyltransferase [Deltaproteobacteria bacterium]